MSLSNYDYLYDLWKIWLYYRKYLWTLSIILIKIFLGDVWDTKLSYEVYGVTMLELGSLCFGCKVVRRNSSINLQNRER